MSYLQYSLMFFGFALWFYAGYKFGYNAMKAKVLNNLKNILDDPETKVTADMDKVTYKFNLPFEKTLSTLCK